MTRTILHPREFIEEGAAKQLRSVAYEAEHEKMLHEQQVSAILEQNWLNMYVPRKLGGLELSMPEIIEIEEAISWADGSSGWVVTLCSGAAWFVGFFDPTLSEEIFRNDQVCFAGSGAINGTANRIDGGYEINGFWPYATGSLMATAFTVNCVLQEKGIQVSDLNGNPVVKSFLLMSDEVKIHRTWNAMGMVATGSHSIEVISVKVPENRSFVIDPHHAILPDPIFKFPFIQLAEITLTANLSGMAYRFVDLAEKKLSVRSNGYYARKLSAAYTKLQPARHEFYSHIDTAWNNLVTDLVIPEKLLAQLTDACSHLVECCSAVVNELYPYCGLEAADTRQEMNRVWRNFHTAGQHNLFQAFRQKLKKRR